MFPLRLVLRWLTFGLLATGALNVGAQQPTTEPVTAPPSAAGPDDTSASLSAPGSATAAVPEARVGVHGVAENRFNPTHGTVFFLVLGMDLADAGRDARVLVNDATLPSAQLFPSARNVGASYQLKSGLNRIEFTGWDALGRPLRTESRVWAGDLALAVDIVDPTSNTLVEAAVTVTLDKQPSVSVERVASDGTVLFTDLPDERLRVEAAAAGGRTARATVAARQGRLQLRLR